MAARRFDISQLRDLYMSLGGNDVASPQASNDTDGGVGTMMTQSPVVTMQDGRLLQQTGDGFSIFDASISGDPGSTTTGLTVGADGAATPFEYRVPDRWSTWELARPVLGALAAFSGVAAAAGAIPGIAGIGGAGAAGGTGGAAAGAGGAAAAGGLGSLLTPTNALTAASIVSGAMQARQAEGAIRDASAANERIATDSAASAERTRLDAERARQAAINAGGSQPGRSPEGTAGARARNRAGAGSTMLTGPGGVARNSLSLGAPTLLGRLG